MTEVQQAMGLKQEGYKEYGYNRIPSNEPCEECKTHLNNGGTIIIAKDTGEYLKLDTAQIDSLLYRIVDAKGRVLNFDAMRGKILYMYKAFWIVKEKSICLRDPKEWTD